jgi:hypothetical protein
MSNLCVRHHRNGAGGRIVYVELGDWRFDAVYDDTLYVPTLAYAQLTFAGEAGTLVWVLDDVEADGYDSVREAFRYLRRIAAYELRALASTLEPPARTSWTLTYPPRIQS